MHEGQKRLRIDLMLQHQPAQRRAVTMIIMFLQRAQRQGVEAKQAHHEQRDARVDFRPKIRCLRIERIVEIEHPCVDLRKTRCEIGHRVISVPAP